MLQLCNTDLQCLLAEGNITFPGEGESFSVLMKIGGFNKIRQSTLSFVKADGQHIFKSYSKRITAYAEPRKEAFCLLLLHNQPQKTQTYYLNTSQLLRTCQYLYLRLCKSRIMTSLNEQMAYTSLQSPQIFLLNKSVHIQYTD